VRPLPALRLAGVFLGKLVESSVGVGLAVVAPRGRVHTGIVAVELHPASDAIVTLVADAVNLTPGTLIVDIRRDPLTLYIHALDVRDVPGIRRSVHRLEQLAVDAFGERTPDAAVDQAAVDQPIVDQPARGWHRVDRDGSGP